MTVKVLLFFRGKKKISYLVNLENWKEANGRNAGLVKVFVIRNNFVKVNCSLYFYLCWRFPFHEFDFSQNFTLSFFVLTQGRMNNYPALGTKIQFVISSS